jgi:hypothetical protein
MAPFFIAAGDFGYSDAQCAAYARGAHVAISLTPPSAASLDPVVCRRTPGDHHAGAAKRFNAAV